MTKRTPLGLALVLSLGTAATLQAQTASINATARVLSPAVVSGVEDLRFGDVIDGTQKTIPATNSNSGRFTIQGATNANVDISFTLPATLAGPGGSTLAVDNWTGEHGNNAARGAGAAFTPLNGGTSLNTDLGATSGDVYNVYVGARVTSAGGENPGAYTGQIDMTVSYTGN